MQRRASWMLWSSLANSSSQLEIEVGPQRPPHDCVPPFAAGLESRREIFFRPVPPPSLPLPPSRRPARPTRARRRGPPARVGPDEIGGELGRGGRAAQHPRPAAA